MDANAIFVVLRRSCYFPSVLADPRLLLRIIFSAAAVVALPGLLEVILVRRNRDGKYSVVPMLAVGTDIPSNTYDLLFVMLTC